MKRNAVIRIVLSCAAIIILLGILITGIGAGLFMTDTDFSIGGFTVNLGGFNEVTGTASSSGTADADQISRISVEWASGSITVQPGDVEDITFQETGRFDEDNTMVWNISGKTLEIKFARPQVFIGISYQGSKDLVITVPRDWNCQSLELDAASATVWVNDMTVKSVDFDGASGTLNLENCSVEQLDVDTASGDVNFIGQLQELDCDVASADITCVLTNTPRWIDMSMASGDLELTLPENCGFTLSMEALSGNFNSEFPTSQRNGNHIFGDGSCKINVEAMSGDVIIRKG